MFVVVDVVSRRLGRQSDILHESLLDLATYGLGGNSR